MDPIAPSAPVNFRSDIQPTSIKLSWDPPIRLTNFAYYIVAFISPPSNDTVNVTEPCANVGPLLPETMYTCSCTPFTSDGVAGEQAVISGTTTTPSEHHKLNPPSSVCARPHVCVCVGGCMYAYTIYIHTYVLLYMYILQKFTIPWNSLPLWYCRISKFSCTYSMCQICPSP